jgi:hypothetical protein
VSYLIRVVLPDRPGALGAIATALGHVGADILSLDIIERSAGSVIDDLVVELPADKLADSVVSAVASVRGATVESIRPYAGQIDPFREVDLLEELAAGPDEAQRILTNGMCHIFRAGWALQLAAPTPDSGLSRVLAASNAAPEILVLATPWWPAAPARVLPRDEPWAPADWSNLGTELAVAPLGDDAILVGRPALRWLPSEILRLSHLASIAGTVLAPVRR